jgi:hypothetical protein
MGMHHGIELLQGFWSVFILQLAQYHGVEHGTLSLVEVVLVGILSACPLREVGGVWNG